MAQSGGLLMQKNPDAILILPKLAIQNANCISSPLTWGFPSIAAVLGFVHALQRSCNNKYPTLSFTATAIICHQFYPQVFLPPGTRDMVFRLTRNPVDKSGKTASFSEEGRAHMTLSLLLQVRDAQYYELNEQEAAQMAANILEIAYTLRFAGGSMLAPKHDRNKAKLIDWNFDGSTLKKALRQLLPGFMLISREDLLAEQISTMQSTEPEMTALDALLDIAALHSEPETQDINAENVDWIVRKRPGWIVPIPVGYRSISQLYQPGTIANARDNTIPFAFTECIYSLGQWISPHRIDENSRIFWQYQHDSEKGVYQCICC
ncbi:type I-F CRISPR-associated protein Csy2 (plasmid) [Chlorobium phaeovibrioides]|uniref:Type I-F CRISPR-associated protein Csy2 n=2 Tax=Chlorobium phaeovibrioides TaxID=1094 RepID=A0A5M8I8I6_CHLPH|nr:type I-F CRISPR-associated protein Csy2 [Chlorobium phaeovibrioides]